VKRRSILRAGLALMAAGAVRSPIAAQPPLRIGLTPVFLDDQAGFLVRWRVYLETQLGRPVEFVQRGSYREISELLRQGKAEFAWVCGYPYVRNRSFMRLLAVPVFRGRPLYHSYLIVPSVDVATQSILDLRGRVFAFSDPDSNSGYLYPNYRLITLQEQPQSFFAKSFFTWAHRKVVDAVAARVAEGGAVDGYVWETLARFDPDLTARTRVVARSPAFGFPPFVARSSLSEAEISRFRHVLTTMSEDRDGQQLLAELNLDGFTPGDYRLFASIEHMAKVVGAYDNGSVA
jgi:phosphate/phosphite/phosphonate ABC transporter binding protein